MKSRHLAMMLPKMEIAVRWSIALLLLWSGAYKLLDLVLGPYPSSELPVWATGLHLALEISLGIVLLARVPSRLTLGLVILLFGGYTLYSLKYLPFEIVQDCGCGLPRFLSPESPELILLRNAGFLVSACLLYHFNRRLHKRVGRSLDRTSSLLKVLTVLLVFQSAYSVRSHDMQAAAERSSLDLSVGGPVLLSPQFSRRVNARIGAELQRYVIIYISPTCYACRSQCDAMLKLAALAQDRGYGTVLAGNSGLQELSEFQQQCQVGADLAVDADFGIGTLLGVHEMPFYGLIEHHRVLVAREYDKVHEFLRAASPPDQEEGP